MTQRRTTQPNQDTILHLAHPDQIKNPKLLDAENPQTIESASLKTEGFIHCCTAEQLPGVIGRYYTRETELYLLTLRVSRITSQLVFENTVGRSELFPHIYGPINTNAIVSVQKLTQNQLLHIVEAGFGTITS